MRRSFFAESIQYKSTEFSLVTRGQEINFWNPTDGSWNGKQRLPKGFIYNQDNFQSKNAQISENDIGIGDAKGKLFLINILKPDFPVVTLPGHQEQVRVICSSYELNPQKEVFLSGGEDAMIYLWHRKMGVKMFQFEDHSNSITDLLIIRKDCTKFASTSRDSTVRLFDLKSQACTATFKGEAGNSISTNVDEFTDASNPLLFSSGANNSVHKYDVNNKRLLKKITGFSDVVTSLRCFPGKSRIICSDVSGALYCIDWRKESEFLWNIEDKNMIKVGRIIPNKANINQQFIICKDNIIQIHNLENGALEKRMKEKESIFGIFTFKSSEFAAKKKSSIHEYSLPLTRDLVRMRDEYGESKDSNELFEKVKKVKEKEVEDHLGLTIRSQVKKVRSGRKKKIYRVYSTAKKLRRMLSLVCKEWRNNVRKMLDMIEKLPLAIQNTQVEVQKIEDVRRSLLFGTAGIQEEKIQKAFLNKKSKSGFHEVFLVKARDQIEKNKKNIKLHWHEFNIFRNFIWKTLPMFKDSVHQIDELGGNKKLTYIGSVRNNIMDGLGMILSKKGSSFHKIFFGTFVKGKKAGRGIEYSDDGEGLITFEGNYKNNKREGMGFQTQVKSGQVAQSRWEGGKLRKAKGFAFKVEAFRVWEKYLEGSGNVIETLSIKKGDVEFYRVPKKKDPKSIRVTTFTKLELKKVSMLKSVFRHHIRLSAKATTHEHVLPVLSALLDESKIWFNKLGTLYGREVSYDGSDLVFQSSRLSMQTKLNLLSQVSSGLYHLHQQDCFFHGLNWKHCLVYDPLSLKSHGIGGDSRKDSLTHGVGVIHDAMSKGRSSSKSGRGGAVVIEGEVMKIVREDLKCYLFDFDPLQGWFDFRYLPYHNVEIEREFMCHRKKYATPEDNLTPEETMLRYRKDDTYSLSLMFYCILFGTMHPFEGVTRCPKCKEDVTKSMDTLIQHIKSCDLRPSLKPYYLSKIPVEYSWAIELMKMMWDVDESQRPDMETVARVLSDYKSCFLIEVINLKNKKDRRKIMLEEAKLERLGKVIRDRFTPRRYGKMKRVYEMPVIDTKKDAYFFPSIAKQLKRAEEIDEDDVFDGWGEEEEEETEGEELIKKKNLSQISKDIELVAYLQKKTTKVAPSSDDVDVDGVVIPQILVEFVPMRRKRDNDDESRRSQVDDEYANELEQKVKSLQQRLSKMSKKAKDADEKVLEIGDERRKLQTENNKLIAANAALKRARESISKKAEKLEDKVDELADKEKKQRKKISELESQNRSLKEREDSSGDEIVDDSDNEISDGDFSRRDDDVEEDEESSDGYIDIGGGGDLASGIWESHAGEHKMGKEEREKKKMTGGSLSISSVRKPKIPPKRKPGRAAPKPPPGGKKKKKR